MTNEINFDPIVFGAAANEETFNAPLRQLDQAIKLNTFDATSAPTANDDALDGYSVGSRWLDIVNGKYYVCQDATPTAAVWLEITGGGGGGSEMTVTAGEALAEHDYVYLNASSNKWYKVDIDASPPAISATRGIVESEGIAQDATGLVRIHGEVEGFSGLTAGGDVFASMTPGSITQTKPTVTAGGGQKCVCKVGVATATDTVLVEAGHPIKYVKRESLADAASTTVEHHLDPNARSRDVAAFVSTTTGGASLEKYDSPNRDIGMPLKGNLQASMISHWGLNETSGTRVDAHGSNDLTDNNTVLSAAGKQSNAADFVAANNEYLSHVDNADLSTGDIDYMLSVWAYLDLKVNHRVLVAKDADPSGREYMLFYRSTNDRFRFYLFDGSNTIGTVDTDALGSPATGTWYHLIVWHNSVTNEVGIRVNDTYENTAATSGAPTDTTSNFQMGQNQVGTGYFDGRLDECTFWKRLLGAEEKTYLYHQGLGVTYNGTKSKERLAQGFQLSGGANTVDSIKLYLKKMGSPTGNLTVKVYDDSGGSPNSLVTNGTSNAVAAGTLSTSYGWVEFTFDTPPSLSGSPTQYWIVLETTDSADKDSYVVWGADVTSPGYAGGLMKSYYESAWQSEDNAKDAIFEVLGGGTTYEEQCVLGRWSGGTRDVATRFDDGAGANRDTKTTFKNTSGATLDATCVVEMTS